MPSDRILVSLKWADVEDFQMRFGACAGRTGICRMNLASGLDGTASSLQGAKATPQNLTGHLAMAGQDTPLEIMTYGGASKPSQEANTTDAEFTADMVQNLSVFFDRFAQKGTLMLEVNDRGIWFVGPGGWRPFLGLARKRGGTPCPPKTRRQDLHL